MISLCICLSFLFSIFNCTDSCSFSIGLDSNCAQQSNGCLSLSLFFCVLHICFTLENHQTPKTKLENHISIETKHRRKPENLTPPLSSDGGSSTSGQSPTSTHNGSPPPAVKRPPLNSDKYTTSNDYPTSKKQRISHYRKDIVNHQDINIGGARSKYHDL